MKTKFLKLFSLLFLMGCSTKNNLVYVNEKKPDKTTVESDVYQFNNYGNISTKKTNLDAPRFYNIEEFYYNKDQKLILSKFFHFFKKEKKKILSSFKTYEYGDDGKLSKNIVYESDSLIRVVILHSYLPNKEIQRIYSYEMLPTKTPNIEEAISLTDTIFYDDKNRKIKIVSYNDLFKDPSSTQFFKYNDDGYTITRKTKNGEMETEYKNIGDKIDYYIPFNKKSQVIIKK